MSGLDERLEQATAMGALKLSKIHLCCHLAPGPPLGTTVDAAAWYVCFDEGQGQTEWSTSGDIPGAMQEGAMGIDNE